MVALLAPRRPFMENLGCRRTVHNQSADQAPLQPRQCMIDKKIFARNAGGKLDNDGIARRHRDRLNTCLRRAAKAAIQINAAENLADDMERRGKIRPAYAEKDAHSLADIGL